MQVLTTMGKSMSLYRMRQEFGCGIDKARKAKKLQEEKGNDLCTLYIIITFLR